MRPVSLTVSLIGLAAMMTCASLSACGDSPDDILVLAVAAGDVRAELATVAREARALDAGPYDMLVVWGVGSLTPTNSFYLPASPGGAGEGAGDADAGGEGSPAIVWMAPGWSERPTTGADSALALLAHETGHHWIEVVDVVSSTSKRSDDIVLSADGAHWSFFLDSDGSPMWGNEWQPMGGDLYRAAPVDERVFCPLDLYLMGLVPASAVPPVGVLVNLRDALTGAPSARFHAASRPVTDATLVRADRVEVPLERIIAAGRAQARRAAHAADHVRQLWILVTRDAAAAPAALEALARLRHAWPDYFARVARGLSRVSTRLEHQE